MNIIEWILLHTEKSYANNKGRLLTKRTGRASFENYHIKADNQMKYCENCERVWQRFRNIYRLNWSYYPLGNIPTIGKDRKICPNCEENE